MASYYPMSQTTLDNVHSILKMKSFQEEEKLFYKRFL